MEELIPQEVTPTQLSPSEVARAFSNDPVLSPDEFKLGNRVFKIVDLSYDDYIVFITLLEPLLKTMVASVGKRSNLLLPDIQLDPGSLSLASIVKYCNESLPEMVRIVCKGTDPDINHDEIKKLGKNPLRLAEVVVKQVVRNGIIKDFTDFFGQILPLMRQV